MSKKCFKKLNIQRENLEMCRSTFSGRNLCWGKMAAVFLLQQFNHIFHVIGQVLKEGWREEKVSRTKAWCMLCSVMPANESRDKIAWISFITFIFAAALGSSWVGMCYYLHTQNKTNCNFPLKALRLDAAAAKEHVKEGPLRSLITLKVNKKVDRQ